MRLVVPALAGLLLTLAAPRVQAHPPYGIAADAEGGVLFLDVPSRRLLRMDAGGQTRVVVDFTALGVRSDPHGLALDGKGRAHVAETYGRRIWVVEPDGSVHLHPWCEREDDGRGAVQDLAFGPDGRLHLFRRLEGGGQRTRFALQRIEGNGASTLLLEVEGDLENLYAACLTLDRQGRACMTRGTRVVRQAGARLEVVAGSEARGHADGRGASARFAGCWGIASRQDGALLVADGEAHRLRLVGVDGVVTTLAGTGEAGGTDGQALAARFEQLEHVALGDGGTVYLAEAVPEPWRHRVRVLEDGMVRTLGTVAMGMRGPEGPLLTLEDFRVISRTNLGRASVLELAGLDPQRDWPHSLWVERSQEAGSREPREEPLFLARVEALEPPEARALATHPGSRIFLSDLRVLDLVAAGELVRAPAALFLDGLTGLDARLASVFARSRSDLLSLRGLTTLTPEVARILAARKGGLWLSGLERLDADTARALARWEGRGEQVLLSLGVRSLDVEVARALAPVKGWGLALDRLAVLTPEVAEVLGALDTAYLSLGGLGQIGLETAQAISRWRRKFLTLEGVRSVHPEVRALVERGCEVVSWRGLADRR